MLLSHQDADQRAKWLGLVRSNMEKIRLKGATRSRRRSSFGMRPGRRNSMVKGMKADPSAVLDLSQLKLPKGVKVGPD